MNIKLIFVILLSAALSSCGGDSSGSGGGGGGNGKPQAYVNWESVPAEFHPSIDEVPFTTDGVEKIFVALFGFDRDVQVIYSSDMAPNQGLVKVFKVWKKQASWGDLSPRPIGRNLDLVNNGSYACSIRVQNGQIVELEGGCYVRVEIILPAGAEIEVYNLRKLITRRFIPINNEAFLELLEDATWAADKFAVIEDFLASYMGTRKPALTCYELGKVIQEFMMGEDKFKALRRLHSIVTDREGLSEMIDTEFGYFDREEARRIVGLN